MDAMIEKLKKNEKPFGLLEPEEQAMIKDMMCGGHTLKYIGEKWIALIALDASCCYPVKSATYAIKPDYKPEPEFVDLEIRVKSDGTWRWLGVPDCAGNYDWLPHHFTHLHCLPSLPNFAGFFWKDKIIIYSTYIDHVANRIAEGHKVFARFRSRN